MIGSVILDHIALQCLLDNQEWIDTHRIRWKSWGQKQVFSEDIIWVREDWSIVGRLATQYAVTYRAGYDQERQKPEEVRTIDVGWEGPTPKLDAIIHNLPHKWETARSMPKWASRIRFQLIDCSVVGQWWIKRLNVPNW